MAELFLPVLSHFQNNNAWLASDGRLRYRIVPILTSEEGEGTLTIESWEGPWEYTLSTVEDSAHFPLSQQGLEELAQWLAVQSQAINSRPQRSLAEDLARRKGPAETVE